MPTEEEIAKKLEVVKQMSANAKSTAEALKKAGAAVKEALNSAKQSKKELSEESDD